MLLSLTLAACNNCGVHEVGSAGDVAVGERWSKPSAQVESYFCKVEGWKGAANANGAHSYGPDCQAVRDFHVFFNHDGKRYRAKVSGGVVVDLARRGVCIDM